jgi:hypothetical protein
VKKIFLFISVISLSLLSCSSDNGDGAVITSQNLLGKWYIKGGTVDNGTFENYDHNCSTSRDFQEFFANQEIKFNGYNAACELDQIETSDWILNGNTLTVSNQNFDPMIYEYVYIVESFTTNELILKQTVNEPEGIFIYRATYTRN